MVDQEPATYRPRRAFIEPDAEPAQPERPASPTGMGSDRNGSGPNGNGTETYRNGSGTYRNGMGPTRPGVLDEDQPKPLYRDNRSRDDGHRDNGRQNAWSPPPLPQTTPASESDPPTAETM